jgi:dTMP kinase
MKSNNGQRKYPGALIAIEGLNGSGKSTQVRLLYEWLSGMKCRVFYSEWNTIEIVNEVFRRGKKSKMLTPTTFSLINATDFADRYDRQILPMLKGGFIVLCDRYIYTPYAVDRVRGCEAAWLHGLYQFAVPADLVFYLDLPIHLTMERLHDARVEPSYFDAGMDLKLSQDLFESARLFQGRLLNEYLLMAKEYGFHLIDATLLISEQQRLIRRKIQKVIDLKKFKEGRP